MVKLFGFEAPRRWHDTFVFNYGHTRLVTFSEGLSSSRGYEARE